MDTSINNNLCPACGYVLGFMPWYDDSPSDEICPSCGIQFGYDDHAGGNRTKRSIVYKEWRKHWIDDGLKWFSGEPPSGWNPMEQLSNIGVDIKSV